MKPTATIGLALLLLSSDALRADADCPSCAAGQTPAASTVSTPAAPASNTGDAVNPRHPLKGVVVDRLSDQGALLVKHEEIPGVMRAMTMLLKVDAAALGAVRKGDAITGQLVRKSDGWWLEEVKLVAAADKR